MEEFGKARPLAEAGPEVGLEGRQDHLPLWVAERMRAFLAWMGPTNLSVCSFVLTSPILGSWARREKTLRCAPWAGFLHQDGARRFPALNHRQAVR
jgi:hypothetical protein